MLIRNLEKSSGIGTGLNNTDPGQNKPSSFNSVDLKKALTDTMLELSAAFGRHWESNLVSYINQYVNNSNMFAGATCRVPQTSHKEKSSGSTATVALLRDGYELVVAQVSHCTFSVQKQSFVCATGGCNLLLPGGPSNLHYDITGKCFISISQ